MSITRPNIHGLCPWSVGNPDLCSVVAYLGECLTHFVFQPFLSCVTVRIHVGHCAPLLTGPGTVTATPMPTPTPLLTFLAARCLLFRPRNHYFRISSYLRLHSRCIYSNLWQSLRVNLYLNFLQVLQANVTVGIPCPSEARGLWQPGHT